MLPQFSGLKIEEDRTAFILSFENGGSMFLRNFAIRTKILQGGARKQKITSQIEWYSTIISVTGV
jgi:hypothetical protein